MERTSFEPTRHGFHFSNQDIPWSFLGCSGRNLCGGMAYGSLDYFYHQLPIPETTRPPAEQTPLHSFIYNRQLSAHQFMVRTLPLKSAHHSERDQFGWGMRLEDDFGRVKAWIDRGRPVPILMMALNSPLSTASHWTVVIGYELGDNPDFDGRCCGKLLLYDNNYPDRTAELIPNPSNLCFDHQPSGACYRTYWPDNEFRHVNPRGRRQRHEPGLFPD